MVQNWFSRAVIVVLLFSGLGHYGFAQPTFLSVKGKAIVNASGDSVILRGMGLGGWMLQEGYMLQTAEFANAQYQLKVLIEELIGEERTNEFYDAWLANHVTKADIDSLKAWGFNSVRLPMHYNLFTLPIEDEPVEGEQTWLEQGFTLTDSLVSWCRQNDLYVILDMHATPGGQGYDQGISDYDPTKPSLWESRANQDKLVALWKRLATKYADDPIIAGYDLINEPNWNLPGNAQLKDIYKRLTDTIRSVDQRHILFIEGNWFANDFTGLTPPWDEQLVYSPHKYWSFNDKASIQWVLDIRDQHNVPLYLGESGENSNVWFKDAIELLEGENIGWAWWPMKKIEAIAGPISVPMSQGYQRLLNYWKGTAPKPSEDEGYEILMALTDDLKIQNCRYQPDVIDAMFRQQESEKSIPFTEHSIPGVIPASEYDMGRNEVAYYDVDIATYHVSTGSFTAWNNGWQYRNDGVDIESSSDQVNSNGFNVGWVQTVEWLRYSLGEVEPGLYSAVARVASNNSFGNFRLTTGGSDLTYPGYVPNTGGFQTWRSITLKNIVMTGDESEIVIAFDEGGFNIGSIEFVREGSLDSISTDFLSAYAPDKRSLKIYANKPLKATQPSSSGFQVRVNGQPVTPANVVVNGEGQRVIHLELDFDLRPTDVVKVSYNGDDVIGFDDQPLEHFQQRDVINQIAIVHALPGRVQAEDYSAQSGVQLENTSDAGGGQNVGFLDIGDYLEYDVFIAAAGEYKVFYRTASLDQTGSLRLSLIKEDGSLETLHTAGFAPTGGWQNWKTYEKVAVDLPQGEQKLRIDITGSQFNINWFEFEGVTSSTDLPGKSGNSLKTFPNPFSNHVNIELTEYRDAEFDTVEVYSSSGQLVYRRKIDTESRSLITLDLVHLPDGLYTVVISGEAQRVSSQVLKN